MTRTRFLAAARRWLGAGSVLAALSSCVVVPPEPEMTPLEKQALQTREFDVGYQAAFSATLSVFQDLSYIVDDADKETGFITARGRYEPDKASGLLQRLEHFLSDTEEASIQATAFVESITAGRTRVRVNMVATVKKSFETAPADGTHTTRHSKTDMFELTEPGRYQRFFERLDAAIFIRRHSR